jgi:hypothetical protein
MADRRLRCPWISLGLCPPPMSSSAVFISSRYRKRSQANEEPVLSLRQRRTHAEGVSNRREIYLLERASRGLVLPRLNSSALLRSLDTNSSQSRSPITPDGPWGSASISVSGSPTDEICTISERASVHAALTIPVPELFELLFTSPPDMYMLPVKQPFCHTKPPDIVPSIPSTKPLSHSLPTCSLYPDGLNTPPSKTSRASPKLSTPISSSVRARQYSLSEIIADSHITRIPSIPRAHLVNT